MIFNIADPTITVKETVDDDSDINQFFIKLNQLRDRVEFGVFVCPAGRLYKAELFQIAEYKVTREDLVTKTTTKTIKKVKFYFNYKLIGDK